MAEPPCERGNITARVCALESSVRELLAGGGGEGTGTVQVVTVVTSNGVSGSVANPTTSPAITLTLGNITPASVAAVGNVTGANLSGTNTGDQNLAPYATTAAVALGYQPLRDPLTALGNLANASGYLNNNGSGTLSWVSALNLATATGLPLSTGVTGVLPAANGGRLQAVDLNGGVSLAINTAPYDTVSADRVFAALPAGANGDRIEFTFDVTGVTRYLDFHTNTILYRVGDNGNISSALPFPPGNHTLSLTRADGKWWLESYSNLQGQINTKAPNSGTQTGTHNAPSTADPLYPSWTGPSHTVWYGAAGVINLPPAAGYAGRGLTIYNTGAFVILVDPYLSEVVVRDGAVQGAGLGFTLSSGAGNYVTLISDGARWVTLGYKGTLTLEP